MVTVEFRHLGYKGWWQQFAVMSEWRSESDLLSRVATLLQYSRADPHSHACDRARAELEYTITHPFSHRACLRDGCAILERYHAHCSRNVVAVDPDEAIVPAINSSLDRSLSTAFAKSGVKKMPRANRGDIICNRLI
ncbi:hypothetical protein PRIPAC_76920 [Pristionchus pacificus]|uniref:Uncharacterized protein n=1 Tax=Pristionchus pacificus TaxID=54126 RepID=A0A2A6CN88_PRIPA|nr:hypothetical protein PRIPAC_76920 [Pristionchus pacificus]|eukprot:PDM79557.1 hypothetical protein PRIPAC_32136 [Pristionchus pacificus]